MMLTPAEAAKRARVSASLVYAWVKEGRLPALRMGRSGKRGAIRIEEGEFESFLRTMKVSGPPQEDEGGLRYIK